MEESVKLVEELISKKSLDGIDKFLLNKYLKATEDILNKLKQYESGEYFSAKQLITIQEVVRECLEEEFGISKKEDIEKHIPRLD